MARRKGVAVASAILESGETGLNLFRLLDSARLVPLTETGEGALPALLDAARDWFSARQKDAFVYFREAEDPVQPTSPSCVTSARKFWALSTPIPEFLEHILQITLARREV